ncbi:YbaN family protein [Idiomarina sp. MD25a]|uniref:YbaN family protein n=1 Tax=Idiomarina sp. MD25a TaxID=1889913 RepID=UPI000A5E0CCE|nr:YbaN family protein [Idiomarina sp. MD25a]
MKWMYITIWRCIAVLFVMLGIIGLALPVMPTVPFLIVALWAASKGWPQLETWLLNHPKYGPDLIAWREHRQIRRRNKVIAITMMASGYLISWLVPLPLWLRITVGSILLIVAVWLACLDEYEEPKSNH